MAYLSSDRKADLESELASTIIQIAAINAAFAGGSSSGTKSYTFDAGTGQQKETFNSPLEMIATLDKLYARRYYLHRALAGKTIMTQQLRR